jgi:hypothetical protein
MVDTLSERIGGNWSECSIGADQRTGLMRTETKEEYHRRILYMARRHAIPPPALGRSQAGASASGRKPITTAGVDEPYAALREIRQLQAEARGQGRMPATPGSASGAAAKPDLRMGMREFVAACTMEFKASAALQAHHGTLARYAATRIEELRTKVQQQRSESGIPVWMQEARSEFAANPAVRAAFGSERNYIAHVIGQRRR